MRNLQIRIVTYDEQLMPIQAIRRTVFQQEQGVTSELEFDGQDANAEHLLAYLDGQPVGTTRVRSVSEQVARIERLAVLPLARSRGIGTQLMERALAVIVSKNSYAQVIVHAQEYIKELYEQLGFEQVGGTFDEAGIVHVKMVKILKTGS